MDEIRNSEQFARINKKRTDKQIRDQLYVHDRGKIKIDHAATANAMVKFINALPIDDVIKEIMTMRIGYPLKKQKQMSKLAIGLRLGMSEEEVDKLETIGVGIVQRYLDKIDLQDGINRFNADKQAQDKANRSLLD